MTERALCCVIVLTALLGVVLAQGIGGGSLPIALGGSCSTSADCSSILNSVCLENKCACPSTHVPNADNNRCYFISTEFGSACEIGLQCTKTWGDLSTCISNKCACQDSYAFNGTRCVPIIDMLNESCNVEQNVCHLKEDGDNQNVKCVDGKCNCVDGYEASKDKKSCKKSNSGTMHLLSISSLLFVVIAKFVV